MTRPNISPAHVPYSLIMLGLAVQAAWASLMGFDLVLDGVRERFVSDAVASAATLVSGLLLVTGLLWQARRGRRWSWTLAATMVALIYSGYYYLLFVHVSLGNY